MTSQLSAFARFFYDQGINPEELNSQKFLREFKKKYKVKVHDIPPTQPKSWREIQMLLYNFECYSVAANFIFNPTLKLLYVIQKGATYPNMVQIEGTPHKVLYTDRAI